MDRRCANQSSNSWRTRKHCPRCFHGMNVHVYPAGINCLLPRFAGFALFHLSSACPFPTWTTFQRRTTGNHGNSGTETYRYSKQPLVFALITHRVRRESRPVSYKDVSYVGSSFSWIARDFSDNSLFTINGGFIYYNLDFYKY